MASTQLSNDFPVGNIYNGWCHLQFIVWVSNIVFSIVDIPQFLLSFGINVGVNFHTSRKDIVASFFFDLLNNFF